jgi:hypothetical protein
MRESNFQPQRLPAPIPPQPLTAPQPPAPIRLEHVG